MRVNVIGAGRWGPNLIRTFFQHPEVEAVKVGDINAKRLESVQARMPAIEVTTDVNVLLRDPRADAVVIATPFSCHFEQARIALQNGKHVLVEKPLAPTVEECEILKQIAFDKRLVLAVGHVFLFNPGIRKIKELIDSGELGALNYMFATRTNLGPFRDDANALWDLSSHDLSIFEYWRGRSPIRVSATGRQCTMKGISDVVVGSFAYEDGVMASVHASWLNPKKVREITIVGTKKMVTWNDVDLVEPIRVYDKSMFVEPDTYTDTRGSFIARTREADTFIPRVSSVEPLAAEVDHFVACVRERSMPIINVDLAARVVNQLVAADRSLARGGALIDIPRIGSTTGENRNGHEALMERGLIHARKSLRVRHEHRN